MEIEPDLIFINFGHNENLNDSYTDTIEDFCGANLSISEDASIVLVAQNPQTVPRSAAQIAAQTIRMDQLKVVASRNDYVLVDIYDLLSTDLTSYVSADGVHPTVLGYEVWTDVVVDMLNMGISDSGYQSINMLVEDGELIIEPVAPVKDGATFLGWYTDEALTNEWDFDTDLVQDDMTLYAKYSNSITGSVTIIGISSTSFEILGIAWYFWAIGIFGVYYFGFTKKGRKLIGLKK